MTGIWRCSGCGEVMENCDPAWRWNGEVWEHKCPCNHPQHGHEPARYFGEATGPTEARQQPNQDGGVL